MCTGKNYLWSLVRCVVKVFEIFRFFCLLNVKHSWFVIRSSVKASVSLNADGNVSSVYQHIGSWQVGKPQDDRTWACQQGCSSWQHHQHRGGSETTQGMARQLQAWYESCCPQHCSSPSSHWTLMTYVLLTLWRPLLPYVYSYKASCARPG